MNNLINYKIIVIYPESSSVILGLHKRVILLLHVNINGVVCINFTVSFFNIFRFNVLYQHTAQVLRCLENLKFHLTVLISSWSIHTCKTLIDTMVTTDRIGDLLLLLMPFQSYTEGVRVLIQLTHCQQGVAENLIVS